MRTLFFSLLTLLISTVASANDELKQYAELQALHVETTLQAIDLSLQEASDFLSRNPDADEMLRHTTLGKYVERTPGLRAIIQIDKSGQLKADSFTFPVRNISLKDRAYVKNVLNSEKLFLYISSPVVGRSSGVPFVPISRAMTDRNNEPQGVVAGILTPEILIKQELLCNKCFAGVFREDLAPLVTYPSTASFSDGSLTDFLKQKQSGFHTLTKETQELQSWIIHSEKFQLSVVVSKFMTEQ